MKLPKTAINVIESELEKKLVEMQKLENELKQFQNIVQQKQQQYLTLQGATQQLNDLLLNGKE